MDPMPAGNGGAPPPPEHEKPPFGTRLKHLVFGAPRDLSDAHVFHRLSVVAFLAWVGLGADGLSSSSYGPEAAFRALGEHAYLALPVATLMVATVFIICACYSRIIERFPQGGGGYVVATALLGRRAGVVAGSALLVDYVLTITASIAAAGDAVFSFLPAEWHGLKVPMEACMIIGLTMVNIRGVKESIMVLMPVFLLWLATHTVLLVAGLAAHAPAMPAVAREVGAGFSSGLTSLGLAGMALLTIHAYSLGGGTYTGLEAVSNGLMIMREPRVRTARRTMVYMAVSLALTAGGLTVCYLLWHVQPTAGETLNAVLAQRVAEHLSLGNGFVVVTLAAEGLLLIVAAQAGLIGGPRVLANMAVDSWLPRRFAALSDRLTVRNGILLMSASALVALLYTHGSIQQIVVMYSINVFITFSLSMLAMAYSALKQRRAGQAWKNNFALFAAGFVFCTTILGITTYIKFAEGGWVTLVVTACVVLVCLWIRRHYRLLGDELALLYASLADMPRTAEKPPGPLDPNLPTAAVLVRDYNGLGIHTTLAAFRNFPDYFRNVVFLSVATVDSSALKGADTAELLRRRTEEDLKKYVAMIEAQGVPATYRMALGTDAVDELEKLCLSAAAEFPHITFCAGQLAIHKERWYHRLLHNETVLALQKRLYLSGHPLVILPVRLA